MLNDHPRRPTSDQYPDAVDTFHAAGWTTEQWDQTDEFFTQNEHSPGADLVTRWLRHPPQRIQSPISPGQVLDLFARYGQETAKMLTVMGAGAPERFVIAFLTRDPQTPAPLILNGWRNAITLGLDEDAATGWATTGYLRAQFYTQTAGQTGLGRDAMAAEIGTWTARFGSGAWLWVMAGFTLEEAVELRKNGTVITPEELQVMIALNGPAALPTNV